MRSMLIVAVLVAIGSPCRADGPPLAEKYLLEGRLAEGEKALSERLAKEPGDDQARFGLGATQFLRAVERASQNLYRYGLKGPDRLGMGFPFSAPFAANPNPRQVRYADVRAGIQLWIDDLAEAEATLANVKDEHVELPLHFGQVRLDFDGDGRAGEDEVLWKLYAQLNRGAGQAVTAEKAKEFVITFDRGDVAWLRGYCHFLMATAEMALAYDGKELFARCGHLTFARTDSPYAAMLRARGEGGMRNQSGEFADVIAAIHLLNLPLSEPKRMEQALKHFEAMIALSRESWSFYLKETDNDHEWIPNPRQDTVMPNGKVTEEMVRGWMGFLDQAELIFGGKLLIPSWRGDEEMGVNLRRVFTEPRDFDLVLWVQGTAAVPYLEKAPKATGDSWRRLQRIFGGEFLGFAFWFN